MSAAIGIGTSNLSIEAYISKLQDLAVHTVVDVRAQPFSRFRPHFNRERFGLALKSAGIRYIWMGDKLGNPKDEKGERSLRGFEAFMQTPTYHDGLLELRSLIEKTPGTVALTCAEAKEEECHRQFILQDLHSPEM